MSQHVLYDERRPLNHFFYRADPISDDPLNTGYTWTSHNVITDNKYPVVSAEPGGIFPVNFSAGFGGYTTIGARGLWSQYDPVEASGTTITRWDGADSAPGPSVQYPKESRWTYWFNTVNGADLRFPWTCEVYKGDGKRLIVYSGCCVNTGSNSEDSTDRKTNFIGSGATFPGCTASADYIQPGLMNPDEGGADSADGRSQEYGLFYIWDRPNDNQPEPHHHEGPIYGKRNPYGDIYGIAKGDQVHMKMWHPDTNFINYIEEGHPIK